MLHTQQEIRKRVLISRKKPANWRKQAVRTFFNPLCHETEETFLGFDHYNDRPAWRKVRVIKPLKRAQPIPIIMVPPTGGFSPIDRALGTRLALEGYEVYALASFEGWNDYSADPDRHDRQSIQSLSALKELQKWIKRPHYVIGASLGAMYGLQAFADDPKVKKMILVVGGENFAGIITDSKMMIASGNKKDRMKSYHLKTDKQYFEFMKHHFYVDPGLFVRTETQSDKYLIFVSKSDKVVPTPYQERLIQHLPDAQVIEMKSGHVLTIARTYLLYQKEILQFLNSPLEDVNSVKKTTRRKTKKRTTH